MLIIHHTYIESSYKTEKIRNKTNKSILTVWHTSDRVRKQNTTEAAELGSKFAEKNRQLINTRSTFEVCKTVKRLYLLWKNVLDDSKRLIVLVYL